LAALRGVPCVVAAGTHGCAGCLGETVASSVCRYVCCTFGKVGEGCVCGKGGDFSGVDPSGGERVGDGGGGGHGADDTAGEVEEGRGEEGECED